MPSSDSHVHQWRPLQVGLHSSGRHSWTCESELTWNIVENESEVMYSIDFGDIIKDFADKIEFESEKSASEMKWNDFTYN